MFRRRPRGMDATSEPHRATLTVASYNIHKGQGLDGRVDLMRIAAVIEELDADLVGVQEIFRPQAEMLSARLGMEMHMGVTHTRVEGPYGNAVLTRLPSRGSGVFDLTHSIREPAGRDRSGSDPPRGPAPPLQRPLRPAHPRAGGAGGSAGPRAHPPRRSQPPPPCRRGSARGVR